MKQEVMQAVAHSATAAAVGTGAGNYLGWFAFINTNAPGIGVLLSCFFGVSGLIFYVLTWRKSTLADENKRELTKHGEKLDSHIEESTEQFKYLGDGIKTLLARKP